MHYANGKNTTCEDVFPSQEPYCSDLNTTAFLERTILAENPDLIVFTGMGFVCANIGRFLLYLLSSQSLNIILILFTFDTWEAYNNTKWSLFLFYFKSQIHFLKLFNHHVLTIEVFDYVQQEIISMGTTVPIQRSLWVMHLHQQSHPTSHGLSLWETMMMNLHSQGKT